VESYYQNEENLWITEAKTHLPVENLPEFVDKPSKKVDILERAVDNPPSEWLFF